MAQINFVTEDELKSALNELSIKLESLLREKSVDQSRWLRTEEVAEYLSISKSQVHNLKANGVISHRKLGGINYYDRREIDQLLDSNKN